MLNIYFATSRSCNLRCKYCYLTEKQKAGDAQNDALAIESAREFAAKCAAEGIELGTVTLHGAEPGLLAPEATAMIANEFARCSQYHNSVGIQSNGTLFNDEYFRRFEAVADDALKFSIGVSIDGPPNITDRIRGRQAFRRATAGLEAAIRRGYRTGILCVVGSLTVKALSDFENWMATQIEQGHSIDLKPASGAYQMSDEEQQEFASWLHRTGYARFYQGVNTLMCSANGNNCFWLEFDIDGGCYSCNKTYGESGVFADWKREPMVAIIEKRRTLYAGTYQNLLCQGCEIASICHSGCALDRGPTGKAVDCVLKRTLFSLAARETGLSPIGIADTATKFQAGLRWRETPTIQAIRAGKRDIA